MRTQVSRILEGLRNEKVIGSSLDAELDLYCTPDLQADLERLGDELRFALITSYARVHPIDAAPDGLEAIELGNGEALKIQAQKSAHEKCPRCWHLREDVGQDPDNPELCGRCVENVTGPGEERKYA